MEKIEPVIDTHAHLDELDDPEGAIAEAKQAGVSAIIAVGQDVASNQKIMAIASHHRGYVFPAVGY
ncbi:MAG: TatD family hydrolase, partial [Desulfobacterales bacterium]